jgi:hypothetical protein
MPFKGRTLLSRGKTLAEVESRINTPAADDDQAAH